MSAPEAELFTRVQAGAQELALAIDDARAGGFRVDLVVAEEDRFGPREDMRVTRIEARIYKRVRS